MKMCTFEEVNVLLFLLHSRRKVSRRKTWVEHHHFCRFCLLFAAEMILILQTCFKTVNQLLWLGWVTFCTQFHHITSEWGHCLCRSRWHSTALDNNRHDRNHHAAKPNNAMPVSSTSPELRAQLQTNASNTAVHFWAGADDVSSYKQVHHACVLVHIP